MVDDSSEHAKGGGTTFVTGAAADVRSRASHGLRNATNLTPVRRPSTDTGLSPNSNRDYRAPFKHATTPGLSVLAAVNWTHSGSLSKTRTHLFRSDQADRSTGRTDLDGIVEHHHRETKYRPGPNPHWPVCHQIGPRFIHTCHFISSSGHFIYFHIRWDFILCFARRTIVSATDQGG